MEFESLAAAARYLRISPRTVRAWCLVGKLQHETFQRGKVKVWRIRIPADAARRLRREAHGTTLAMQVPSPSPTEQAEQTPGVTIKDLDAIIDVLSGICTVLERLHFGHHASGAPSAQAHLTASAVTRMRL